MIEDVYADESDEVEIDIPLTGPQDEFVFHEEKYPAIIGGLGSGKTQAGILRSTMLMSYEEGCWIGYYMPTYDLISLRAMPGIEEWCDNHGIPYKSNQSKYFIDIEDLGRIIFRSYEKPSRIIAYEVAHSIVDELDTLTRDKAAVVWKKVNERNRAETKWPAGNTIGNVTTPDQGYTGFCYQRWGTGPGKKPMKGHAVVSAPTMSNIFIGDGSLKAREEYVESIRKEYDPLTAQAMIDGIFINLTTNKVYHVFNRNKHHSSRKLKLKDSLLHVSIDFNIGGCCGVIWVDEGDGSVAVKEFVSHDTQDFCNNLAEFKQFGRKIKVYPDASGSRETTNATESDLAIIRKNGFVVVVDPSNPAVRDRINAVNGGIAHGRVKVNTHECPLLTDALETQGYDNGKPEKFKDHPSIDDWNDSAGYFVNQKYPVSRIAIMTSIGQAQ